MVGFDGGILGSSNGKRAMKWNISSNINFNGQVFVDTANSGGSPCTAPKHSLNSYADNIIYFSTNAST